jgi:glycosyltransferase involved in cell wall biosynthesis
VAKLNSTRFRKMLDRLFPEGTKRRRLCQLARKSIKYLFQFGLIKLVQKIRAKCAIIYFRHINLIGINMPQPGLPLVYQKKRSIQADFNPKITVIVPNYNHAEFLRQRLETVYNQTYRNIEVILLDDASRDESRQILKEYQKRFPEITRCCFNDVNSGGAFYQWRRGMEMARGDLIWIAESDDYCSKNLLSELVNYFANEAVMLAYCRSVFVDKEAKQIWSIEEFLEGLHPELWLKPFILSAHSLVNRAWAVKNVVPNVSSAVFRNPERMELLDNEDWQRMRICGDWIFYLNLVRGGLVAYTPHATNYFRIHQNNTSVRTYSKDIYYQEHEMVAKELIRLYRVDEGVFEHQRQMLESHWRSYRTDYSERLFNECYSYERIRHLAEQRKPNILMVAFALSAGGGETFPIKLANLLKDAGYGITFLNCYQEPTEPGVRRMLRRDIPLLELEELEKLDIVANDMGIEIAHSHHASIDVKICNIMKNDPRIQLVVTTHGMYEMIPELIQLAPLLGRVDKFVYTADKNLAAFDAKYFDMDRFVRIDNALDVVQINKIPRLELNVPEGAFLLCLVSRAIPGKGWQEAIESVKMAREISERQIHLLLIGEGPEYDRLKPVIQDDYIHFLGFRENIRDYFAASDLGFLPSRFPGESFPLVIIDCFHANRPMLASNVGEINRMMVGSDGTAGTVFDLEDWSIPVKKVAGIIATYAKNKNLYLDHLSRVSAAATKFDPRILVSNYETIYLELFKPIFRSKGNPI